MIFIDAWGEFMTGKMKDGWTHSFPGFLTVAEGLGEDARPVIAMFKAILPNGRKRLLSYETTVEGQDMIDHMKNAIDKVEAAVMAYESKYGEVRLLEAPQKLKAWSANARQVNLSWEALPESAEATGYRIYRNGVEISQTAKTSYQDATALNGKTYTYSVKARDAAGNGGSASTVIITVSDTLPLVTTPDLVYMLEEEAVNAVEEIGLKAKKIVKPAPGLVGEVRAQIPAPGTLLPAGSTVTLTVSSKHL